LSEFITSPEVDLSDVASGNEGVSALTIKALRGTKKWVRLVGIILLVIGIITALVGVAMILGGVYAGLSNRLGAMSIGVFIGGGALYLLFAAIYGVLGIHLVKYASAITRLLEDGQIASLESALAQQQKFWRVAGGIAVIVLVMLVIMVIGFAAAFFIPRAMR
jgi:uncharacterized membrane protein